MVVVVDYITNRFLLESNYEQAQLGKGGMERDVLGGGGGEYVSSLFYNCQHLDSGQQQLHLWSMTGGDKTTTN